MKIYIAGPITGCKDYKTRFKAVAEKLRELGFEPINPAADEPEGWTYRQYIDRGLRLLEGCNMICMISGYNDSPGARLEYRYAQTVGMPAIMAVEGMNGWIIKGI